MLVLNTYLEVEVVFGNYGSYPGQLDTPQGISFTPTGDLLVADTGNGRVQIFRDGGSFLRTIPAEGETNPMRRPRRAVMAQDGRIFVADPAAHHVFIFDSEGRFQRALSPAGEGRFEPTGVGFSRDGLLFVTDTASRSLLVFKVM